MKQPRSVTIKPGSPARADAGAWVPQSSEQRPLGSRAVKLNDSFASDKLNICATVLEQSGHVDRRCTGPDYYDILILKTLEIMVVATVSNKFSG